MSQAGVEKDIWISHVWKVVWKLGDTMRRCLKVDCRGCELVRESRHYTVIQLEGKKVEEVKGCFDALEQHIAGQDNQIKVLLHRLAATKEGRCRCREGTPKVISCRCFDMIRN